MYSEHNKLGMVIFFKVNSLKHKKVKVHIATFTNPTYKTKPKNVFSRPNDLRLL